MNHAITPFIVLSTAYIIAYTLTSGFIYPIQTALLPAVSKATGLLFIPHGVRIIGIYYFGWKAIAYLLPASYLMWFLTVYGNGLAISVYQPTISLIACYLGVSLAHMLLMIRSSRLDFKAWKFLIFAGVIGSIFNGIGLSLTQSGTSLAINLLGYVIGDITGLLTSLFILMYLFKFIRIYRPS